MAIRYSIIIPTYNRAPQLLLTLASFETQTFPKVLFEIIVADDGSTDETQQMIQGLQASYSLVYVSQPQQSGRAAVRNLGLRHASGEYIIFCDADFLVLPDFLNVVDRYHSKYPKAVLSGIPHSWDNVYTHYYPDFSSEEKAHCRNTLIKADLWKEDYEASNEIMPLITPEDLLLQRDALLKVVAPSTVPSNVKKQFAKTDVAPWMLFITRCVSVKRSFLARTGGFNERFVLYGLEDWDLGYRLHRLKIPFYSIKETVGYHQEHPNFYRGNIINTENLKIMYETYGFGDPSLNLFVLIPPSEDFVAYKNTLRVLRRAFRSRLTRSSASLLRRMLRLSAKYFCRPKNTQAYKRSLQRIKIKTMRKKSPVARVIRKLLRKSGKLAR